VPSFISRARARARSQSGFTIIELIVSALIVVVFGTAMAQALIDSNQVSTDQRSHSQADGVAEQDQERLRGMSAQELIAANGQQRTVPLDGRAFTVTSTSQFLNSSGGASCGTSGAGAAAYYKVISSVNWPGNLRPPVVEQSIITPPGGGILLTQVENQIAAPVSGVSVAATGPDDESATTDSSGCTVLAGLPSGSYNLTLTLAGYVDQNGNASPLSRTATVTGTGTAAPSGGNPVYMAQAGTISAVLTSNGGALTGQEADALTWDGTGATYSMSGPKTYGPLSSPAATLPTSGGIELYPFAFTGPSYTNDYHVWPGKCVQMEPPTGVDTASISPGSSQTLTLQEPALDVVVTYAGTRVAPADVKLTFTSGTGTSCTDSWYATVASGAATASTGSLAFPGQPFVTSSTSGSSASVSGDTGTYTVCADYTTGSNSYKASVASVTNTNFAAATLVTVPITSSSTAGTC
jgi:type II secretory pathway pseudopilin PulG